MKMKKIALLVLIVLFIAFIALIAFNNRHIDALPTFSNVEVEIEAAGYDAYLREHLTARDDNLSEITISPLTYTGTGTLSSDAYGYGQSVYHLTSGWVDIALIIPIGKSGMYEIDCDYYSLVNSVVPIELSCNIDGELPYTEAEQIGFDTNWQEASNEIGTDRYGNDVNVLQERYDYWLTSALRDTNRLVSGNLLFYLSEGAHTIRLEILEGEFLLGNTIIKERVNTPTYAEYCEKYAAANTDYYAKYEAEQMLYKSSSTISMGTVRDVDVTPFSLMKLKLNVVGSGNWTSSGESITWQVDVPVAGMYDLTFKVKQTAQFKSTYRTLYVNDVIPFEEAEHLTFGYDKKWQNVSIHSFAGTDYSIYLEQGINTITLAVDSTLFADVSSRLEDISNEMASLGLDIVKLTGNNIDKGIDWDMEMYFPTIIADINGWMSELNTIIGVLHDLYGYERTSQAAQDLNAAIGKLEQIVEEIDELPRRLTMLSEGSSCAAQLVSSQVESVLEQPLVIDCFYLHASESKLPSPNANFFKKLWIGIERFFASFFDASYSEDADSDELVVWVNRSRQYVDILQKLVDDQFTTTTGVKVKISLMSDDGKLILANSAGQQPDVALGVSAWIPNDYGMRGMLTDLTTMPNFLDVISVYEEEQLVPMIYDNGLYGLPETENFYVMIYRKDILNELGLSVPETWDDVIDMLPVLQRYGMNFYIPLSSSSSSKSFDTTTPFIYQFGGDIYQSDAFGADLENEKTIEALTFITDLYREYGMAYQVTSFFNYFRYGTMPIGIADFGTYLQLVNSAAEINGLWDIALVPGVKSGDTINRSMPGAQQAGVILANSTKQNESWQFLSWWMSTATQELFSSTLINTLGTRYLWNSANMEAFKNFSWKSDHKAIILKQWESLKEVPRIPGYYIVEREISNTWNKVVFDDANLRSTLADAQLRANKEIIRKMKEFKYLDSQGNILKNYQMPTAAIIAKWRETYE